MRFVWAVVAFVLATLLIGAGIAQRTVFMGPTAQQAELNVEQPSPFVLVDGAVLRENPGQQTLLIRGDGDLFAAYGRTADLEAWLADATYTSITLDKAGATKSALVEPVADAESDAPGESDATPTHAPTGDASTESPAAGEPGRSPVGSDLWLDSFSEQDQLITDMQLPEGMSVLIAKDGTEDAPTDIVVSWPLDASTPWVGPLIAAGGAVLLFGLVMYVLAIRHQRRGRGPRRKGPGPLPATEPISVMPAEDRERIEAAPTDAAPEPPEPSDPSAEKGSAPEKNERRVLTPRRARLVLPALGVTALMLAGCSSDSWPQISEATPSPSPTETVITPDNQKPPAVTEAQASRILEEISTTLEEADAAGDIELAGTRLEGPALAARETEYKLRAALPDRALPAKIPTETIEVLLPQATDSWPRTVLALSKDKSDDTVPPVILTMTQADPWAPYKVSNIAEMQASTEVPQLAPAWLGTSLITESAEAFLTLSPDELAGAFADLVDAGDASEYRADFDPATIELAESIVASRGAVTQALIDNGAAETSSAAFDIAPSADLPVALATLDSGAIVAVSLVDSETITPTSADAVIRFGENAEAKTLTGVEESANGVVTTYGLQLFFSVPSQGSTQQIRLLAVHQDILNVEVIK
ncbi:glycosyl transferase [Microbacterium sp. A204]|uniref:glycosyl transferase n=1 Tax=Microbacterium sp. A204 TaxID=3457321 RepID=UPI003FD44D83